MTGDNVTNMSYEDLILLSASLMSRIEKLEEENVGLTNELYEIYNRLDLLEDNVRRSGQF
jgi:uncharacterized protein (UPF0335 family)